MSIQTATLSTHQSNLAPTVFSILDSKIQFLEYQMNIQFDPLKQPINHLTAYEQLMDFCDKNSKSLKLLQILKEWVSDKNAAIIFKLLQEEDYLKYTETQLEKMVKIKEYAY